MVPEAGILDGSSTDSSDRDICVMFLIILLSSRVSVCFTSWRFFNGEYSDYSRSPIFCINPILILQYFGSFFVGHRRTVLDSFGDTPDRNELASSPNSLKALVTSLIYHIWFYHGIVKYSGRGLFV